MSFRSIDEIEKFSFEDCTVTKLEREEGGLGMELEALIVKPDNSQNTNYVESYAGTVKVHLINGKVLQVIKEGYRYLDANDQPIEEVPDTILTAEEAEAFLKTCHDYYLYAMDLKKKEEDRYEYTLALEVPREEVYDTTVSETYRMEVSFTRAEFSWQRYMNRVQR